jgi:hypothetical protein
MQAIWSVKVILNGRTKVGSYYDALDQMSPIITQIRRQMESLDHSLENFVARYSGSHVYNPKLCHKTFKSLVLDDHCPWQETDIGGSISIERIKFPAAPVRDFFLSAPATILYRLNQEVGARSSLRLAILTAYMTGFHRFFYIGMTHFDELSNDDPALVYHKKAMLHFGTLTGDHQVGRLNPTGVDFKHVYIDATTGKLNDKLDKMVDDLVELLSWINDTVGTEAFSHTTVEMRFLETIERWKPYKTDIAEFRLMMVVQICCLAGIIVKPHKDLHNLVYPVSYLGAAAQLAHVERTKRGRVLDRICTEFGMEDWGHNAVEGMLCETSPSRVCKIMDYVFKGQSLFTFGSNGELLIKKYGETSWEPI